ncbi:sterol desaturase family protein [Luteimonas aquatica]|uniref:sterol desaturase family protein n=1 Tax=Luteimonas aquatica TaxID=450364 RepID=UPI001F5A6702|nr:sterol desaturase family protein [Luteimonas aquatica]
MQDTVQTFRDRYRAQVSPRYSAVAHASFITLFGAGCVAFALSGLRRFSWPEALALAAGLLAFNGGVYLVHRWLGHRKTRLGKLFYRRHTGDHHSFFSPQRMSYEQRRDWRVILFPPWLIVLFAGAFVLPAALLAAWLTSPDMARLLACGLIAGYLLYEFFHTCHHLPDGHPLTRLPWLRQMRRLHQLHHHRGLMGRSNFNIVLPLTDWVCGTLRWIPERDASRASR